MANESNLKPIEHGDTERAKQLQELSVKKRAENKEKRALIKNAILKELKDSDLQEIARGIIARSKNNYKDLEVMRDTIGEKPVAKVEADLGISYEDAIKGVIGDEEY